MATSELQPESATFTAVQKEYLSGFMEGIARRNQAMVNVAGTSSYSRADEAELPAVRSEMIFGTSLADATRQERWKHEEHPLDGWDRILAHAEENKFPNDEDTYRMRNFGVFFVGPAQNSFMLRCRIPAGELTAAQLRGLGDLAEEFGNGSATITTRSNLQIREIASRNLVNVLTRLQSFGLTSRGSGVDNVRNITASPTAGFDPQELLDTRPFAQALHHYILNHRELYNLPRKFNIAFEGGGSVDTLADTNDLGFVAVKAGQGFGQSLQDDATTAVEPGVYFRLELAGITGHQQFAGDSGILVKPSEAVPVAVAMIRVFIEQGDRANRKKARLKYLLDKLGLEQFLFETQKKLAFPLIKFALEKCARRSPALRHGHIGVYRQKQKSRNYVGAVVPVGVITAKQMRRIADISANYGSGQLRLTPWQNLLIPDIADGFVETVKRQLVRMGLHHDATNIAGGLVACTGSAGCKFAATDTKGQALALAEYLNKRVRLDQPINIHLTGCPNSCAQHYIGDIGLQGVKVNSGGASVDGYNLVFGGGFGADAAIAKEVFKGIAFVEVPKLLHQVLKTYSVHREGRETFSAFIGRHEVKKLQELFSS